VFSRCTNLASVTFGDGVTNIGAWAFFRCSSLTNLAFGQSLASIGRGAFWGCERLVTVRIPDNVTRVEADAFSSCASLADLTLGNSVTSIGWGAFAYCTNLTGVYFEGNAPADASPFYQTAVTVYYLPGTTGWGSTFSDRPTALWLRPKPVILCTTPGLGIQANGFGFIISWATNSAVVVEASTTLSNPTWSPVSTNTLINGCCDFRDPEWAKYPGRFYRVRQR
jgi:hypothetical protein